MSPPRTETDKKYDQSEKGKARVARYNQSEKGKARRARYRAGAAGIAARKRRNRAVLVSDRPTRPPGPAGSPGPIGAMAQRERRARPEYRLARALGISVKVAREMLSTKEEQ